MLLNSVTLENLFIYDLTDELMASLCWAKTKVNFYSLKTMAVKKTL